MGSPGTGRGSVEVGRQLTVQTVPQDAVGGRPAPPLLSEARPLLDLSMAFAVSLGLETYDPYDTKGTKFVQWTQRASWRMPLRQAYFAFELVSPMAVRRMLRVRKAATAGGTARMAQACIAYHRLTGEPAFLERAETLLKWLLGHPGSSPVGLGWGVPFDWSASFGDVPAHTAVSHTTHSCGSAFLDFHDATGKPWAIEAAEQCCEFLTKALNQTVNQSGSIALSYTPADTSQVVNISAETAGFLLRCGRPGDQPLVWKLGRFVCETQDGDGSFRYSAPGSVEGENPVDHYHTGMVLNGLIDLAADRSCATALHAGLKFLLEELFRPDGFPKMRPDKEGPLDATSAGESLVVLCRAVRCPHVEADLRDAVRATLNRLVGFVGREMSCPDGAFIYRRYGGLKMRIDSLRWAQALICHGLAEYCLLEEDSSGPHV